MSSMEHIVSRADLIDTGSSSSASPEPGILQKLRGLEQFDFMPSSNAEQGVETRGDEYDDDGLEFQLFAAPKSEEVAAADKPRKIRLRSPSIDPDRIGFVRPHRSQSYYFTGPVTEEDGMKLESAALTGAQVQAHSTAPWPGSAYAWKVLRLPASGLSKDLGPASASHPNFTALTGTEVRHKRTRPGKKYRIKLRKRHEAARARNDAKKAAEEAKEVAEREKRTRRNREKKVKRKAKEKAKKAEDEDVGDGEEGAEGGPDG